MSVQNVATSFKTNHGSIICICCDLWVAHHLRYTCCCTFSCWTLSSSQCWCRCNQPCAQIYRWMMVLACLQSILPKGSSKSQWGIRGQGVSYSFLGALILHGRQLLSQYFERWPTKNQRPNFSKSNLDLYSCNPGIHFYPDSTES